MVRTLLLLLIGVACRAEAVCPYLNSATAAGMLGEKVTVSVSAGDHSDDASCEFTANSAVLRIEVKTMSNWRAEFPLFLAQCGANATILRGIGNEAVACTVSSKNRQVYDLVLSRVRERAFLVRVTSNEKGVDHASLREETSKVAEQVAGSLF